MDKLSKTKGCLWNWQYMCRSMGYRFAYEDENEIVMQSKYSISIYDKKNKEYWIEKKDRTLFD